MKSVFLIKTPLQLLNAVEAKSHFNLKSDDCVLIIMGDRKSQPQILNLANVMNEWGCVIVLNNINIFFGNPFEFVDSSFFKKIWQSRIFSRSFFNVYRLNKISRHLGEVEYVFIGYARYIYMKHFVNIVKHKKTIVLDDGHATIELAKERRKKLVANIKFKKKLKLLAKRYFQGIKDQDKESLCFFTIYDVLLDVNDQLIKNNFSHIRSSISEIGLKSEVYFLGSPISESGIMSQDDYIEHLARVRDYYKDSKLTYIAHRRESPDSLKRIEQDLNINVVLFEYPIEYQLAIIGPRPRILASFISSALDSCRMIFGNKLSITSFRLDLENCVIREREEIESIYDSYESSVNETFSVESVY